MDSLYEESLLVFYAVLLNSAEILFQPGMLLDIVVD